MHPEKLIQVFLLYKLLDQGKLYKNVFLLIYNKATPAVASVGVCSIE